MTEIIVINGRTDGFAGSIYIGRPNAWFGLTASPLANPFIIGPDGTREQVITQYRHWLWQNLETGNPVLNELNRIHELAQAKTVKLSCWCKPAACHGDVVKSCIEWLDSRI